MSHPAYTRAESNTRDTFLSLMWSLSYPGKIHHLPTTTQDPFQLIADTLLDIETSFYTADEQLIPYLTQNGARALPSDRAAYHFYKSLEASSLDTIKTASIGSLMYPDKSATLIIGASFGEGNLLNLSGPGIPPSATRTIRISNMPSDFWSLREKAIRYPRGWDIYLVDGEQVIGLPRTTLITVEE